MNHNILLPALSLFLASCGQGEARDVGRYAEWEQLGDNKAEAEALREYLGREGVGGVIPLRQLLRNDTEWWRCGAEAFDVPPKQYWANMVPTLKLIRDQVQPLVGPVEALSVFRGTAINDCIGGANRSQHLRFYAIDMRPTNGTTREQLIDKLCALHARNGKAMNMGLGIYKGTRFHIDTAGFRRWGDDHHAATSPCIGFVAPQRKSR